jgi:hypothetical protein
MLNRLADLVRLRAYADTLVQPVGRSGAVSLSNLEVGSHVTALIELARADGTVRAQIDGQAFELRLPMQARPGDTIAMQVTAREPQLRFMLEPGGEPSPQTALSETARFITALLTESDKLPPAKVATAGPPLLDTQTDDSKVIAVALKNALAESGMFYEAHLAQWVAEERPLTDLMREPQSRLSPLSADGKSLTTTDDVPQLRELPVHRDALAVVRQQLQTLETQQMVWLGRLWPGQHIEWQVGEEPTPQGAPAEEREWQSTLRLTLPRLGEIDAAISLSSRGVRVNVRAVSERGAATLEANRQSLRERLLDAGITPLGIGVVHVGE